MRIGALLLVTMLGSTSCSLVFKDGGESEVEVDECLGQSSFFERGAESSVAGRFEHIDYRQGTLTFWARALAPNNVPPIPADDFTLLLSLGGIAVVAIPDYILVSIDDGTTSTDEPAIQLQVEAPDWSDGNDHFLSLRWDTARPLSGELNSTENIEIRIDGVVERFPLPQATVIRPSESPDDAFIVGDGQGHVHVDQLVIYDRPLFVHPDAINEESALKHMSLEKKDGALIANGGFDVLFATVSPKEAGCAAYNPEAWSLPASTLLSGDLRLGFAPDDFDGKASTPIDAQQIYPGGGAQLFDDEPVTISFEVSDGGSYTLEVLYHTLEGAKPTISGQYRESGETAFSYEGAVADNIHNPARAVISFQGNVGSIEDQNLDITLTVDGPSSSSIVFHSLRIYANALEDPGFEEASDLWTLEDGKSSDTYRFETVSPYAGAKSLCLMSGKSPDVIRQEPEPLSNDGLYLFGSQMRWNSGSRPSVGVTDGSLFASGRPYESKRKAFAAARDGGQWQTVATVGRRLFNEAKEFNNKNDFIRLGTHLQGQDTNVCIDSAFVVELNPLANIGTFPR